MGWSPPPAEVTNGALTRAIRSAATDALIGESHFERTLEVVDALPPLRGGVSLECHLGPGRERTDLLARAMHADAGALAHSEAPELEQARLFSRWWSAAPGAHRVRYVDLEFDMDRETCGCFVGPMIEPTLVEGLAAVAEAMRQEGAARARFEFAAKVIEAPDPAPFGGCPEAALRRCFEQLPPEGFIGHAGSLRFRMRDGSPLVRLIPSMRRRDLGVYLRRVEWPGKLAALEDAAERYLGTEERIDLDLDMRAFGLAPDFGFCRTFWDRRDSGPLRDCLGRMVSDGLVTERQADRVAAFAASDLSFAGAPQTLTVKIKGAADGQRSAKVYLSLLRMR